MGIVHLALLVIVEYIVRLTDTLEPYLCCFSIFDSYFVRVRRKG